jgi:hypothetical protein
MRLTPPQLKIMLHILTTKPTLLDGADRALVSELHADKLIAFSGGRYVVTGRGQCAMTVSGYRGSFAGVEIQPPHRPVAGRVLGTTAAERRLIKIN